MRTFSAIHALLVTAACFFLGSANAAEEKFHPFVIELWRCQHALEWTFNLLPLCARDDWDVPSITKAAQAYAKYECELGTATNGLDMKKPDYKPVVDAKERRDKFLQAALTQKQIRQLFELKGVTDLIYEQADEVSDAFASTYADKLPIIVSKSPVLTPQEVSGWEIPLQDVTEILQRMKKHPKLSSPEIQSAIDLAQVALKNSPQKAAALLKQVTETVKKNEADL